MKLAEFFAKLNPNAEHAAAITAAQAQVTALEGERDTAKAELATANTTIAGLTAQLTAAQAEVVTVKANMDKLAAAKALEITGAQVVPPVPAEAKGAVTDRKEKIAAFNALTDPAARAKFWQENLQ